ncbi:hypothetical protein CAPTEDRAFT_223331 [Capitella teleta]|uniref:serine--tRNA ligase n=1 Tax=Capitella teleta TaxID=283909 RepID=R7T4H4_CAPTE|nr:hypothetical protein CAPTEDRAFT_223331 [Capitella teleta]|eukprot:ELT87686.1 hypothetical protein CAPTEDRAFT_223331 [Capitella teleta]
MRLEVTQINRARAHRTLLSKSRNLSSWHFTSPSPEYNLEFLTNPSNADEINQNVQNRKGVGDIKQLQELWSQLKELETQSDRSEEFMSLQEKFHKSAGVIPNMSHPDAPIGGEDKAILVETFGEKQDFDFAPKGVVEIGEKLGVLRTQNVTYTTGPRSYYFMGDLAELEDALVEFTISRLQAMGFCVISVPNLLHSSVIEGCGFQVQGERTQVYRSQDDPSVCLAGTGEMPLAGYFMNKQFDIKDLPQRVATVSRCYRAETSTVDEERGIFRVHQFTKVEMFGVTANESGEESSQLLSQLIEIQKNLFSSLDLHVRVLDMPTQELGAPATRKFDMEAWMPAKKFWGEISSASNCTDFQSRRLNIKYRNSNGELGHCHTVNGTGCAVPRVLMSLIENNQQSDGTVVIPTALRSFMAGQQLISASEDVLPNTHWIRLTRAYKKQMKK